METTDLLLDVTQAVEIDASLETVFERLLHRMGPGSAGPEGQPLPLVVERWPGGRWYRDLGGESGHLWGFVQVYKPPRLLEVHGPLFMSFAATSHVQWRLEETGSGTKLTIRHQSLGLVPAEMRAGIHTGWERFAGDVKEACEK